MNTLIFVGLLLGLVDRVDPGHSFDFVSSFEDLDGLFIDRDQLFQKKLGWAWVFRQNQVFLNALAEILENINEESFAKEMAYVDESEDKGRP